MLIWDQNIVKLKDEKGNPREARKKDPEHDVRRYPHAAYFGVVEKYFEKRRGNFSEIVAETFCPHLDSLSTSSEMRKIGSEIFFNDSDNFA